MQRMETTESVTYIPTKAGCLELRNAAGRCVIQGCKVRGGGLIQMQETTNDEGSLLDLAWGGKRVVICGEHLKRALTGVIYVDEEVVS